jgi:hypothetical protein
MIDSLTHAFVEPADSTAGTEVPTSLQRYIFFNFNM